MLIVDDVLLCMFVGVEKFVWIEYLLEEVFNILDVRVGWCGWVQQLEFGGMEQIDEVEDYGYELFIFYLDIEVVVEVWVCNVFKFDLEGYVIMMFVDMFVNQCEVWVVGIVYVVVIYVLVCQIIFVGIDQFFDYVNLDLIGVLKIVLELILIFVLNMLVMGCSVWLKFFLYLKIVNVVKGNLIFEGIVICQQFLELFLSEGFFKILIGDVWYNIVKFGQVVNLVWVWGNYIVLLYFNLIVNL